VVGTAGLDCVPRCEGEREKRGADMGLGLGSFEGAVRVRAALVGRCGAVCCGVRGSLLSVLEELLSESPIVGDVVWLLGKVSSSVREVGD
jgi:hypothetical protein